MKKISIILLSSWAALHFIVVCLGVLSFDLQKLGRFGYYVSMYGQATGAGSGFGFFAPEIGASIKAEFDVVRRDGSQFVTKLDQDIGNEPDLRVGNLLGILSRNVKDEKIRRAVAASLAGKMYQRHPEAQSVQVRMESFHVPFMTSYAQGVRGEWETLYKAKFVKN